MREPALLSVNGVTLQYRTGEQLVTATYRVSFDVRKGDRFVVLGPSGCGKSTLLKAIGGYLQPVEGEMLLNGTRIGKPGPDRAFVFQEFDQLLPWKTVRDNVVFALTASGKLAKNAAIERALHFIDKVGLTKFADNFPHTLSGGMKQRVAIARAMAMEPQILLMDEPFAALDALTRGKMQEDLLELWNDTRFTVLFVTHSIPEAIRIGNRILLLTPHPGRAKAEINCDGRGRRRRRRRAVVGTHSAAVVRSHGSHRRCLRNAPSTTVAGPRSCTRRRPTRAVSPSPRSRSASGRGSTATARCARPCCSCCSRRRGKSTRACSATRCCSRRSRTRSPRLLSGIADGEIPAAGLYTLSLLLKGYVAGLVFAALLTAFASVSRIGADLLETLTAMFNPLPSIALLPLALIWFGLGDNSVIFVLVHAVLWAVALNTFAGFRALSPTLRMVGQNYGLSSAGYIVRILIPGAFPSILTGLKVGWAFAWRTLIAAELVFGVSSGSGGLGWYIFENKNQLRIPEVFAGLLTVIIFGLFVENVIFRTIEQRTVRRWGMQT